MDVLAGWLPCVTGPGRPGLARCQSISGRPRPDVERITLSSGRDPSSSSQTVRLSGERERRCPGATWRGGGRGSVAVDGTNAMNQSSWARLCAARPFHASCRPVWLVCRVFVGWLIILRTCFAPPPPALRCRHIYVTGRPSDIAACVSVSVISHRRCQN